MTALSVYGFINSRYTEFRKYRIRHVYRLFYFVVVVLVMFLRAVWRSSFSPAQWAGRFTNSGCR